MSRWWSPALEAACLAQPCGPRRRPGHIERMSQAAAAVAEQAEMAARATTAKCWLRRASSDLETVIEVNYLKMASRSSSATKETLNTILLVINTLQQVSGHIRPRRGEYLTRFSAHQAEAFLSDVEQFLDGVDVSYECVHRLALDAVNAGLNLTWMSEADESITALRAHAHSWSVSAKQCLPATNAASTPQ